MSNRRRRFHGQTKQWCKESKTWKKKDSKKVVVKSKELELESPTEVVGLSVSNSNITEDDRRVHGRSGKGNYSVNVKQDWEDDLIEVIQNNNENYLGICRDTGLIEKYGGTEKTWKNRITIIKRTVGEKINNDWLV